MNQITIDNILLVEVPEDADLITLDGDKIRYVPNATEDEYKLINAPAGNWQFIGTTDEVSEAIAQRIVKSHYSRSASFNPEVSHYQSSGSSTTYMDYENGYCTKKTALESYQSWLRAKNIPTDKRFAIIKKI